MKNISLRKKQLEEGFTVIEVLIAMAIFLIGVLAIIAMQTASMSRSGSSVKNNQAGFLAVDTAESLLRLPYDDSSLDAVSTLANLNQETQGPYTVTWAVFDETANGSSISGLPAAIANNAMFDNSNKAQVMNNISPDTKIVMVNVTHPLGERARVVFIKPNI